MGRLHKSKSSYTSYFGTSVKRDLATRIVAVVIWLLGVLLALDVIGWRTSKEKDNAKNGMYIAGKLVLMR